MNMTKLTAVCLAMSVVLTGCSSLQIITGKRSNGSLDYQNSQKLDPIHLPASQASGDFIPLYDTPAVGTNTLDLTNESGTQYALPKPPQVR